MQISARFFIILHVLYPKSYQHLPPRGPIFNLRAILCPLFFNTFALQLFAMTIPPQLYSLQFSPIVWALAATAILAIITVATVWWPRFISISRRVKTDDASPLPSDPQAYPSVSVIVYNQGDSQNLHTLLPQILGQDYPAPMEVIVVNDMGSDDTATIVAQLEMQYSNLYMTFTPERSRSLSRRKLSITLGIKAARYDVVALTCSNCRIESPLWLRSMAAHLADPRKEIVIGYARPWGNDQPDTDSRRRRRAFDDLSDTARWLSAAIHHRPYMASGYNLAYRRSIFFEHKGFSRTLNLNYGDDDIFINEIATRANTAVELSHNARVRHDEARPALIHDTMRSRRDFTARYLPRGSYRATALASWAWWIAFGASAGAAIAALPSLIAAAAMLVVAVGFCLIHQILYRRCARALTMRPLFFTVPWLSLTRPLRTWRHNILGRRQRRSNYTQII